jgi:hypothetical protein
MGKKAKRDKVQAPLLRAYLKELPSYPSHVPAWVVPAGWGVGLFSAIFFTQVVDGEGVGLGAAIALGWLTVVLLRDRFKGRTESEKAQEVAFATIRKLKFAENNSGIPRSVTPDVLRALEEAMAAYNAGMARIAADHPYDAAERQEALRIALHACFVAATPMIRGKDQSGSDWKAICDNERLNNDVVEAIHSQMLRMREAPGIDHARLAALRELEIGDSGYESLRDG